MTPDPTYPIDTCWTWAQFNAAVDELCPLECKRIFGKMNADGSSVYYRNQIRQAVLDLANFIPEFTRNNETIYFNQDFVPDGDMHVGVLPPMAEIDSAWFYSTDKQRRFEVRLIAWENRFSMARSTSFRDVDRNYIVPTNASLNAQVMLETVGTNSSKDFIGFMAISPKHDKFYVYPKVEGEWVMSIFWDGSKLDFRDDEQVGFEEEAAQAAAWYVQAQFASYVDKDLPMYAARMQQYGIKRSNIYTRSLGKGKTA